MPFNPIASRLRALERLLGAAHRACPGCGADHAGGVVIEQAADGTRFACIVCGADGQAPTGVVKVYDADLLALEQL